METCHLLDIKELNMIAYHPQTDGLVEQFNRILAQSLSMHISKDQKDWDRHYSYGLICLSHFSIRHHRQIANFPFVWSRTSFALGCKLACTKGCLPESLNTASALFGTLRNISVLLGKTSSNPNRPWNHTMTGKPKTPILKSVTGFGYSPPKQNKASLGNSSIIGMALLELLRNSPLSITTWEPVTPTVKWPARYMPTDWNQ